MTIGTLATKIWTKKVDDLCEHHDGCTSKRKMRVSGDCASIVRRTNITPASVFEHGLYLGNMTGLVWEPCHIGVRGNEKIRRLRVTSTYRFVFLVTFCGELHNAQEIHDCG